MLLFAVRKQPGIADPEVVFDKVFMAYHNLCLNATLGILFLVRVQVLRLSIGRGLLG